LTDCLPACLLGCIIERTLEELILLPFKHIFGWQIPLQKLVHAALVHKEDVIDLKNIVKAFSVVSRLAIFVDTLHEWRTHELLKQSERLIEGVPVRLAAWPLLPFLPLRHLFEHSSLDSDSVRLLTTVTALFRTNSRRATTCTASSFGKERRLLHLRAAISSCTAT